MWIAIFFLMIVILLTVIVFCAPETVSENLRMPEIYTLAKKADVIIIFNSGGWGITPPEAALDFTSIFEGMQATIRSMGLVAVIIPYLRTKNTLLGKISSFKDSLKRFEVFSKNLADEIEILMKNLPDKKIIIIGLSFGGFFTKETMKKIPKNPKVCAVAIGIPFWFKTDIASENFLQLDNEGNDSLAEGDIWPLGQAWFKASFKWLFAKISGKKLSFAQAIQAPGHQYLWHSPIVGPKIVAFLGNKLKR